MLFALVLRNKRFLVIWGRDIHSWSCHIGIVSARNIILNSSFMFMSFYLSLKGKDLAGACQGRSTPHARTWQKAIMAFSCCSHGRVELYTR